MPPPTILQRRMQRGMCPGVCPLLLRRCQLQQLLLVHTAEVYSRSFWSSLLAGGLYGRKATVLSSGPPPLSLFHPLLKPSAMPRPIVTVSLHDYEARLHSEIAPQLTAAARDIGAPLPGWRAGG